MKYTLRYPQALIKTGKSFQDMPLPTQNLIEKLETAFSHLWGAEKEDQERLLPIIVQSDAVLTVDIEKASSKPKADKNDKFKLLELEAKARQLRRKQTTESY